MQSFGTTDLGLLRKLNEDYYFQTMKQIGPLPNLFIVADGMGGHKAGEVASKMAVETMVDHIMHTTDKDVESVLEEAVKNANLKVYMKSVEDDSCYGMGTTLVVCTVLDNSIVAANVGDSRLYILGRELTQLTVDHSVVEELVQMGAITREESRTHPDKNLITRSIGISSHVDVDLFREETGKIEKILLCSDGLTTMLEDGDIEKVLKKDLSVMEKGKLLVEMSNEAGGWDNITLIIVDMTESKEAI